MTVRKPRGVKKAGAIVTPAVRAPDRAVPLLAHDVLVTEAGVGGTLGPAGANMALVVLWNGRVTGTGNADACGTFFLPRPASIAMGTLDVLAIGNGFSVLPTPLGLDVVARVEVIDWSFAHRAFVGAFHIEPPPAGPVLVEARAGEIIYLRAFALPGSDGVYRFSGPLRRLVRLGETVPVELWVDGQIAGRTLVLLAAEIGVVGHMDETDRSLGQGWIVDLSDRNRRSLVDLRIDGALVASGEATDFRADLLALGLSDGQSGFMIPVASPVARFVERQLHAYLGGTMTELVGSPVILSRVPEVVGYLDAIDGPFAGGWAVNMVDPTVPLALEAVCDGEVIGFGTANMYRGDVESSGLPTPWCGFRFLLNRPLASLFDRDINLRVVGTDTVLGGSPRQVSQNNNVVRFLSRAATIPTPVLRRLIHRMTRQTEHATLSIVMPVYNTPKEWLIEALNSVLAQWSANWELICVDDASPERHVRDILLAASRHDPRIHVVHLPRNGGIAAATNAGIRLAQGEYVAFMDHDDVIEPDAVHKLLMAAKSTGADLIYSDEVITAERVDSVMEVRARPAFSHDYYLSHPYFVHMIAIRTALAKDLGGWDETLPISADVDFVLRAIEHATAVAHVPSVLYRWRTHETSAGHLKKEQVTETMCGILSRHLERMGRVATVRPGLGYNEYRVDWHDDHGEVLIVIPTKNRVDLLKTCIDSIEKTGAGANYRIVIIDHQSTDKKTVAYLKQIGGRHTVMPYSGIFNYALMNNLAVRTHGGASKYVLFLNNDVEAIEDGWIPRLRSLCARPEVGAVGPLLLYGDRRIQHAGVLVGFAGAADHAMKFHAAHLSDGKRHSGYNCTLTSVRDYSAVTAACLMMRMDVFEQLKGFDETFVVGFNDTDLCLRTVAAGYKVLYDGYTMLYHHESATRTESKSVFHPEDDERLRDRWGHYITGGDPFYSPLLAPKGTDHVLRQDRGCKGMMAPRVVRLQKLASFMAGHQAKPRAKPGRRVIAARTP